MAMFAALLASASPATAQDAAPPAPRDLSASRPVSVLPADPGRDFSFRDTLNTERKGSFAVIGTHNGKPIYRADNPKGSINQYGVNTRWMTSKPIRKGDVMLIRFAARAVKARQESGEAEGLLTFEQRGGEREVTQAFSVGPDWTQISVPFVATRDHPAGETHLLIAFSNLEQTIEFAEFDALNFENRIALSALPTTSFTYVGRAPDAAWRKAALERIDAIRTAPLAIRVVDRRGRPVRGAMVHAAMTHSAFLWGSEVNADKIVEESADAERYRREIIALFDTTVIGNGLKWPRWVQPDSRVRALAALDWLRAQDKRAKGHNLAWTAWKFSPGFVAKDPAKQAQIASLVDAHIREITAATKGKLIGWDVVNEPVHETDYFKNMPREHVAEWFKLAEASDPSMQLTLNEYGMLNRSSSPLMIADFLEFSRMLRKNGARVDVLGVQGHVGQTPRAPVSVLSDLDLLAVDGQQIQVTEFDMNTRDEALQADYTRDFLIALYSHKAVTGFIMWGFWESSHWKPAAAMFRPDWSEKPNLAVWRDLVLNRWKTKVAQTTGASGEIAARGHLGRYRATATLGGKRATTEFELKPGGAPVVITLQ
jgi:GH35 family endo-1,4-beta-xylanase